MTAESVRPSEPASRRLRFREEGAALLLALAGLAVRLLAARGSSLSGDEALHFQLASAPDAAAVYRISLTNAHPPLFLLLLHFWRVVAVSESSLRLLPVAFGAAFLWAAYRWAASVLGRAAGLGALAFAAFLPPLVSLSAEVRAYSLLLLLSAAALWQLERAFESGSAGRLALSTALLALAILTHYSAVRVAAAAFVYAAVRLLRRPGPRRLAAAWMACQAAIGALFLLLYA
ncbi:MAG: glycosyltransferase family 39 protein, partial [Acidobacteriota bacterium]